MPIAATKKASPENRFLTARVDTYALLAALLSRPPGPDLLLQLQGAEWPADMPQRLMAACIELRKAARASTVAAVEKEFQVVFVGLGQGEVVPYASRYGEGLLMARPLASLRQDLAKMSIVRRPDVHEAEDHVGLLCETMALLASSPVCAIRDYACFFDKHVAGWMFDFFADVQKAPSARFYGAVAGMGLALLHLEQTYIDAHRAAHVS